VDVPWSVSISWATSVSCWLSWAYAFRVKNSAQAREECKYSYPACELTIWGHWASALLLGGAGGMLQIGGISPGVGCLYQLGELGSVPEQLQCVCRLYPVPFLKGRYLSGWFWQSIAGCHSIAAFTMFCTANWIPRFLSSQTSVRGSLIRYCVSCIAVRKSSPLAV